MSMRIVSRAAAMAFLLTLPAAAAETAPRATYTRNVAIVLYDGVEILDFAGPRGLHHDAPVPGPG